MSSLLREPASARKILAAAVIFIALFQSALLLRIGNGLSPFDAFDEADANAPARPTRRKVSANITACLNCSTAEGSPRTER